MAPRTRIRRRAVDTAPVEESQPTRSLRRKRKVATTSAKPFNQKLADTLAEKGKRLAELEDTIAASTIESKTLTKEIEELFAELYGSQAGKAKQVGAYWAQFAEEMGRASVTVIPDDFRDRLIETYGEEEGEAIFMKSISITQASAKKHLPDAVVAEVSKIEDAKSKGVKFSLKKPKK
ncbi:MAG: hypothetical protein LPH21_05780 [Shewanella sp.]|nr:hypothetical protein [Shewanella sp.]